MQKSNIIYRINYILLTLLFLLGALFFRQPFVAILLILMLILPIISIYLTHVLANKMSTSFTLKTASVNVNNNIVIRFGIKNQTIFPFLNCEIVFYAKNLFYDNDTRHILSLSARPRKTNSCDITFPTSHVGMCEISFTEFCVTDPLHLYTVVKKCSQSMQIPVMPKEVIKEFPLFPSAFPDNEDDEYVNAFGQPSRNIKEVRDYRPGDRLVNIHWKMTAKKDSLLVKEFEQSAPRSMLLLPEFSEGKLDDTLSTLYSYMKYLIKNNEIFKVCLYNSTVKDFELKTVSNLDEAYDTLLSAFFYPKYKATEMALYAFKNLYGSDTPALRIHGEEIAEK